MESLYGLTYIPVDMDNLEIAFKMQKRNMDIRSRL